jgi:type IV pilus assembly protein PilE
MECSTHGDEQEDTMNILLLRRRNRELGGKQNSGFTLVELLIVITILGLLAGIAVPVYLGQRAKAARTEATSNLQTLRLLEEQYFAENGCYYATGGPPAACTNASFSGLAAIQGFLTKFNPGLDTSLRFTYCLKTVTVSGSVAAGFTAVATGKSGTPVSGTKLCIDQNNNMNAGAACTCP